MNILELFESPTVSVVIGAGLETEYSVKVPVPIVEKFEVWRDLFERGPELPIPFHVEKQVFYDFIQFVYSNWSGVSNQGALKLITDRGDDPYYLANYLLYDPLVKYYVDNIDELTIDELISLKLHDEIGLRTERRSQDLKNLELVSLPDLTDHQKLLVRRLKYTCEYEEHVLKVLLRKIEYRSIIGSRLTADEVMNSELHEVPRINEIASRKEVSNLLGLIQVLASKKLPDFKNIELTYTSLAGPVTVFAFSKGDVISRRWYTAGGRVHTMSKTFLSEVVRNDFEIRVNYRYGNPYIVEFTLKT